MDIFSILRLLLGLSFFLFGMQIMSGNLEEIAGGRLEQVLQKLTRRPAAGLLTGMGVTMAVQSSSAVTVLLVGLVDSGLMPLKQTVAVIFGANIGTTLTAWLLSLAGLEGENLWVQLLKPENFSALFGAAGIVLLMFSKKDRRKRVGSALLGFALLMQGMELMKDSVAPLADDPAFARLMVAFRNPLLGVLAGAVITAVIQSSSASVGILQALSLTGSVTRAMAVPLVMGQNIGTCVTALLSAVGAGKNAKRVAMLHLLINVIGTAVCLVLFLFLPAQSQPVTPVGIAVIHTLFNVTITALLFPFSKKLLRLVEKI
ncbi:MAG: Na/Pi cotransporter family protein [Clostridia bacterium]|nr:Na/Pi cotransporter family protein [Clostridia bacterium]